MTQDGSGPTQSGGRMRRLLLDLATVLSVASMVTMTIVVLTRSSQGTAVGAVGRDPPQQVENWTELASSGHRIGPPDTPLTIVVFADFECPACGVFANTTFPAFARKYPGAAALVYRHWPLPQHRFAYAAARAAECAAAQGRFDALHEALFARQDEIGLKSFAEFAVRAGVPDLAAFTVCHEQSGKVDAIERDIDAVVALGGTGTPTVIVNGWLFRDGIRASTLDSLAREVGAFGARPESQPTQGGNE